MGLVGFAAGKSWAVTPPTGWPDESRVTVPVMEPVPPPEEDWAAWATWSARSRSAADWVTTWEKDDVSTRAKTVRAATRPMRASAPRERRGFCIQAPKAMTGA